MPMNPAILESARLESDKLERACILIYEAGRELEELAITSFDHEKVDKVIKRLDSMTEELHASFHAAFQAGLDTREYEMNQEARG